MDASLPSCPVGSGQDREIMAIAALGIALAKHVVQLHGVDEWSSPGFERTGGIA